MRCPWVRGPYRSVTSRSCATPLRPRCHRHLPRRCSRPLSHSFRRVCLIGDAAFTLRPHAAAGTAKAAEDAWKLGGAVLKTGGDVAAALERWEPGQLKLGRRILV